MEMSRVSGVTKVYNRRQTCDQLCMLYFLRHFTCIFCDKQKLTEFSFNPKSI